MVSHVTGVLSSYLSFFAELTLYCDSLMIACAHTLCGRKVCMWMQVCTRRVCLQVCRCTNCKCLMVWKIHTTAMQIQIFTEKNLEIRNDSILWLSANTHKCTHWKRYPKTNIYCGKGGRKVLTGVCGYCTSTPLRYANLPFRSNAILDSTGPQPDCRTHAHFNPIQASL